MDKQIIQDKIIKIIEENCQFGLDKINLSADLKDNYGIDSILIVNILVEVECIFDISIDSSVLTYESFSTIEKITDYVEGVLISKV